MDWALVGMLAGALTCASQVPQVVRACKRRRLADVSPVALLILVAGMVLWEAYGLAMGDAPLIVATAIGLAFSVLLLALWLRFERPRSAPPDDFAPVRRGPFFRLVARHLARHGALIYPRRR